jgi:hypothetical protein
MLLYQNSGLVKQFQQKDNKMYRNLAIEEQFKNEGFGELLSNNHSDRKSIQAKVKHMMDKYCLDESVNPHEIENVFITGGAL